MKKFIMSLLIICIILNTMGCTTEKKTGTVKTFDGKVSQINTPALQTQEQKVYYIPLEKQKESYSVEDFRSLHSEYLKINKITLSTSPENDKTGMSKADQLKYYTIYDITPKEVKEDIGCQIFKVNYSCETYVVYKSKVFHIGLGFGGYGVVSLTTCDFDENGQKDLIYTFSWGSGMHRSNIGIFNFTTEKDQRLDFIEMDKDILLEKTSDKSLKVYVTSITPVDTQNFSHFKLSKQAQVAVVQSIKGEVKVVKLIN